MISFLEKLRGFVEGFALRFIQDSHQIFFLNLGLGIAKDSVIFANDLGWIRIPKKGFGLITNHHRTSEVDLLRIVIMDSTFQASADYRL